MNVWISYKEDSNTVEESAYPTFFNLMSYNLATPTCNPLPSPTVTVLLLKRLTYESVPIPTGGEPLTWLSSICLPTLNGDASFLIVSVVLGFSTSKVVVPIVSTSYPRTYAFPGPMFKHIKSSVGTLPCWVNWSE